MENLNTVLDDNKTLTLANGDRIPMLPTLKLLFEVENLNNASPATVSRVGIIYISTSTLGWKPVIDAWLLTLPAAAMEHMKNLVTEVLPKVAEFVETAASVLVKRETVNMCTVLTSIVNASLPSASSLTESNANAAIAYGMVVAFAVIWAFGGVLKAGDRLKLQELLTTTVLAEFMPPAMAGIAGTVKCIAFDFLIHPSHPNRWVRWDDQQIAYSYAERAPNVADWQLFVPTSESMRNEFLLTLMTKQQQPVMLVGEAGCGKSRLIHSFMSANAHAARCVCKTLFLSYLTKPAALQQMLQSSLEKRVGQTYGPVDQQKMLLFVDDVNLPRTNEWGDQETGEALRQLLESQGYYSLERPGEWLAVEDISYLAAMRLATNASGDIPARLRGRFSIFVVGAPSAASVSHIFKSVLGGYMEEAGFPADLCEVLVTPIEARCPYPSNRPPLPAQNALRYCAARWHSHVLAVVWLFHLCFTVAADGGGPRALLVPHVG
jgi:dynein heavy chain